MNKTCQYKHYILILAGCLTYFSSALGQLSEQENTALDQLIADNVEITADVFSSKKLSAVCDAQFYDVKHIPKYRSDDMYNIILLMKTDEGFTEVQYSEDLLPVIKPDFKITNKKEAATFEAVLDELYPVFSESAKQIIQKENQWIFVRSDSWGEMEGTIVTISADGTIEQIQGNQTIE